MSRAALEALASSPDRLASVCSPRDAAELAQGVQGALRSVSNAADGEDVRDRVSIGFWLSFYLSLASRFLLVFLSLALSHRSNYVETDLSLDKSQKRIRKKTLRN